MKVFYFIWILFLFLLLLVVAICCFSLCSLILFCMICVYLFIFCVVIILLVLGKLSVVRCARYVEERWPSDSRKTAPRNCSLRRAHSRISSHRWKKLLEFLLAPCGCSCNGPSATARLLDPRLFDGSFGKVNPFSSFLHLFSHGFDRTTVLKGFLDGRLGRNPKPDSLNWLKQYCVYIGELSYLRAENDWSGHCPCAGW